MSIPDMINPYLKILFDAWEGYGWWIVVGAIVIAGYVVFKR